MGIYAGQCSRIDGNIIMHPIVSTPDRSGYEILPSQTVNKYTIIEGHYPLKYTPEHPSIPETPADLDLLTYEEITERFTIKEGEDQLAICVYALYFLVFNDF